MSDNLSVIGELTQKMQSTSQMQNDLNEAMALVTGMFRDRYVNRMNDAMSALLQKTAENPPDTVKLLNSMKPFLPAHKHEQIDSTVNMLIMIEALGTLSGRRDNRPDAGAEPDEAIHDDGIYEVDKNCAARKNGAGNTGALASIMLLAALRNKR